MTVKSPSSGQNAALTGNHLVEQIRMWLTDISEARESVHQVNRFGLLLTLIAGLFSTGLLSLAAALGISRQPINSTWSNATLVILVVTMAVFLFRPSYSRHISHLLAISLSIFMLGAAMTNGLLPMAVLPGLIAFLHVLVRPNTALAYSGFMLITMTSVLLMKQQGYDTQIFYRLLVSSAISIITWQLVSRFWRRLIQRVSVVTTDMSEVVQQLDKERDTARREARQALLIEPASGLLNRDGFLATLAENFNRVTADGAKPVGLVAAIRFPNWIDATTYLDLPVQENLLRSLIIRLRDVLGPTALLARSGSEDYLAWIPGDAHLPATALLNALMGRTQQLYLAITSGTFSVPTRPRIGVSRAPDDGHTADTLLADAELALMEAMRQSQSEPLPFTAKLLLDAEERHRLLRDLKVAVAAGDFELHYQPVLAVSDKHTHKGEALIRWRHPQRGLIPPDTFIPLAEQTDLIIGITDWVLQQVAAQVRTWRRTLHPQLQISINMPPAYLLLCAREPQRMLEKLKLLDIAPHSVLLEITEGVMLDVTPELVNAIDMLRALGFMIAMDDFGVGYSSFGQLCKLKLDFVKLDKTFIRDLERLPRQQAICRAIVRMAHELGCKVVAEGIETDGERQLLTTMNADYLQGFLLCRPLPANDFHAWTAEQCHTQRVTR